MRPFRGAGIRRICGPLGLKNPPTEERSMGKGGVLEGAPGPRAGLTGEEETLGSRLSKGRELEKSMFSGIHKRCLIAMRCAGPGDD